MSDPDIDPNSAEPSIRPPIAVIPVTVSERGIKAIKCAGVPGLIDDVLNHSKSIHSRKVHMLDEDGKQRHVTVPYGSNGEVLKFKMRR